MKGIQIRSPNRKGWNNFSINIREYDTFLPLQSRNAHKNLSIPQKSNFPSIFPPHLARVCKKEKLFMSSDAWNWAWMVWWEVFKWSKCCLTLLGLRASAHKAEHQVSQTGTRERERHHRMQTTEILKSGGEKCISKAGQIYFTTFEKYEELGVRQFQRRVRNFCAAVECSRKWN